MELAIGPGVIIGKNRYSIRIFHAATLHFLDNHTPCWTRKDARKIARKISKKTNNYVEVRCNRSGVRVTLYNNGKAV